MKDRELTKILSGVTDRNYSSAVHKDLFFDFVNNRSNIEIRCKGDSGGNGKTFYIKCADSFEERYSDYVEDFSDCESEVFFELIGRGYSPQSIAGAIDYVSDEGLSQADAADRHGTCCMSIRTRQDMVREKLEDICDKNAKNDTQVKINSGKNTQV